MFRYLAEVSRFRPKATAGYIFFRRKDVPAGHCAFPGTAKTLNPNFNEIADYKTFPGYASLPKSRRPRTSRTTTAFSFAVDVG